jgi:hypothetical protein
MKPPMIAPTPAVAFPENASLAAIDAFRTRQAHHPD